MISYPSLSHNSALFNSPKSNTFPSYLSSYVYASFLFSDDFINLTAWLCGIKPQGRLEIDRSCFGVVQVG